MTESDVMLRQLEDLRARAREAEVLVAGHAPAVAEYRRVIEAAFRDGVTELQARVANQSDDPFCRHVIGRTADYLHWMRWALGDLAHFAVAVRPDPDQLRAGVAACGLVYFACRVLDDFVDRHFLYRNRRQTLLADLAEGRGPWQATDPDAVTVLTAVLLIFDGLRRVVEWGQGTAVRVLDSGRGLLIGALMDCSRREDVGAAEYERLIRLKNVDYWRVLYTALDPDWCSPLYPFLNGYYALAQKLNDLQEYPRDEAQGRPNLVTVCRRVAGAGPPWRAVEQNVGEALLGLARVAERLPEPDRSLALVKLGESRDEAARLGLFALAPVPARAAQALGLLWHSGADEFVDRLGPDAMEELTGCPVCGSAGGRPLFRKQGFGYRRCGECGHIYVSPRLRPAVQERLATELDGVLDDPYLDPQRVYAEYLCRRLRHHARGPRLLDVGFGRGHLMRVARAYGFQVYGVEGSAAAVERLGPVFGRRVTRQYVGADPLPWGSFDVAVVSHMLEHAADPRAVAGAVRNALNPDGFIYAAVPDSASVQYRVFGKRWDAVNPVAHYQFFNYGSLTRLLRECGFEPVSRVRMPPVRGEFSRPWMALFRQLGGDELGEVAVLARRVPAAAGAQASG
jgi:SAM-dependent methyltransferase